MTSEFLAAGKKAGAGDLWVSISAFLRSLF